MKNKLVAQLLGLMLFSMIVSKLDLAKVISIIYGLNLYYFFIANALFIILIIIKSLRWQSLMNAQDIKYSISDSAIMYAAAIFIGSMTPGNLGDFIKVLYLKEDGYKFGKSFISILLDRLFDVISIMALGFVGISLFLSYSWLISLIIPSIILAAMAGILSYKNIQFKLIISAVLQRFIPEKFKANASETIRDFRNDLCAINSKQMIYAAMLTIIGWFLYFAEMCILASAIHINISYLDLIVCLSIAHVITLIPISVAGIGTRDTTLIVLFSYLGKSSESALALSMTMLAFYISNSLICIIAWLIKPIDLSWK